MPNPGRERHSKGMDMVGYSRDGKRNLPIVLTEFNKHKQEITIISPTSNISAGVYAANERRRYWKEL
jgi:homospermidine synthase